MELNKLEVAARLNIANRTLETWCKKGYFPMPTYLGRRAFWLKADVDLWFNTQFSNCKEQA